MAKIIKFPKESLLKRLFRILSGMNGSPFNRTEQYFGAVKREMGFKK